MPHDRPGAWPYAFSVSMSLYKAVSSHSWRLALRDWTSEAYIAVNLLVGVSENVNVVTPESYSPCVQTLLRQES